MPPPSRPQHIVQHSPLRTQRLVGPVLLFLPPFLSRLRLSGAIRGLMRSYFAGYSGRTHSSRASCMHMHSINIRGFHVISGQRMSWDTMLKIAPSSSCFNCSDIQTSKAVQKFFYQKNEQRSSENVPSSNVSTEYSPLVSGMHWSIIL